jgi:hypothetical protein
MEIVVRAPELESSGTLKTFRLVPDIDAKLLAQHIVEEKRCSYGNGLKYFCGPLEVGKSYELGIGRCCCHRLRGDVDR